MTEVLMPQMGESIAEGTVIRWIKKVGDTVERDEPLFEISTDKVDAEIPSPAAGVLKEILVQEGETVAVNSVVARLAGEGSGEETAAQPAPAESAPKQEEPPEQAKEAEQPEQPEPRTPPAEAARKPAPEATGEQPEAENVTSLDERRRTRSSPLVRKIAKENDVDISRIEGTGVSGRVTKKDILEHIETPRPAAATAAPQQQRPSAPAARAPQGPTFAPGESVRVEPMSVMRRRIADHMIISRRTSAHVSTVFEFDFTGIDRLRKQHRDAYAGRGVKLTFMPFIAQAVTVGLREFPIINSSVDNDSIVYKQDVNLGVAVALDWGLIVPVIRKAHEKNVMGLAGAINDLGERARTKKLNPDDVQGGTFTITNPGVYGGLFGLPIINQPQVAILGVGGIKKRPVVIESDEGDSIAIRSMCYMSLSFDHRIIDGAVADQFMARIKSIIESADFQM